MAPPRALVEGISLYVGFRLAFKIPQAYSNRGLQLGRGSRCVLLGVGPGVPLQLYEETPICWYSGLLFKLHSQLEMFDDRTKD